MKRFALIALICAMLAPLWGGAQAHAQMNTGTWSVTGTGTYNGAGNYSVSYTVSGGTGQPVAVFVCAGSTTDFLENTNCEGGNSSLTGTINAGGGSFDGKFGIGLKDSNGMWLAYSDKVPFGQTATIEPQAPPHDYNADLVTTENLTFGVENYYSMNCEPQNIATSWVTEMKNSSNWIGDTSQRDEFMTALDDSIAGGNYVVYKIRSWENGFGNQSSHWYDTIQVVYSPTGGMNLKWFNETGTNGVIADTTGHKTYTLSLHNYNAVYQGVGGGDCRTAVDHGISDVGSGYTVSLADGSYQAFRIFADNENIPTGFTGTIPTADAWVWPDLTTDVSIAYKVENKHVTLWNTTPTPPLTDGMACKWTIANESDGVLKDVITGCDQFIDVDVNTYTTQEAGGVVVNPLLVHFAVVADKNNDGVILEDEELGTVIRNLNIDGQNYTGTSGHNWEDDDRVDWYSCVDNQAPFIHIPECVANFGVFAKMLSSDAINLGIPSVNGSCRTLGTVGDWMRVENKQVCPKVPESVRNVVTPFIIFALSLLVVGYIARKGARDIW